MAQEFIKMRKVGSSAWVTIRQPDEDMGYSFETTYREDSARNYHGTMSETPLFTVESFSYAASDLTIAEMSTILQIVAKGGRFQMHYFSPYYGTWRDGLFYVGKGSLSIGQLDKDNGLFSSLSFNIVGVDPI